MKKLFITTFFAICLSAQAQIGYWTAYQFDVNPGSEELVLKLFNEYFSKYGVAEGVTVTLFENHFKDRSHKKGALHGEVIFVDIE